MKVLQTSKSSLDSYGMKDCGTFTGVHTFHEVNYLASCGKAEKTEKVRVMNANKKTQSPLPSPTPFLSYSRHTSFAVWH